MLGFKVMHLQVLINVMHLQNLDVFNTIACWKHHLIQALV